MKFSRTFVSAALMAALCTTSCMAFAATDAGVAASATATAASTAAVPAFDLDADVNRALKTFGVPGMAVAIVKDGKVVAAKGYGVRKLGEPEPVGAKTLFEVASNSKAFTAAALAMLVDEGKIAWDDPVTKHLPGFQMYDAYVTGAMISSVLKLVVGHHSRSPAPRPRPLRCVSRSRTVIAPVT